MSIINLRPTKVRVTSVQGADIPLSVVIKDTDTGEPINITSWVFTMPIMNKKGTVLNTLTIGDGITIVSTANGELLATIDGDGLIFTGTCEVNLTAVLWATDTTDTTRPFVQFNIAIAGEGDTGNCCQTGECLGGDVTVYVGGTELQVNVNACFSLFAETLQYALNQLDEYNNIEAAQADGLLAGEWFVLSASNGYGLPKIPVKI